MVSIRQRFSENSLLDSSAGAHPPIVPRRPLSIAVIFLYPGALTLATFLRWIY
jgi:hypothetical protein